MTASRDTRRLLALAGVGVFGLLTLVGSGGGGGDGGGNGGGSTPTTNAWGTAGTIESEAGNAISPQIAVDGAGNAFAVWQQSDGTINNNIWANRFSAGAWGTAQLIETGAGDVELPQIAVDGSGNALAVWSQFDGAFISIWANRFDAVSGVWGTADTIETSIGVGAFAPQIAMDAGGNAIAVWTQFGGAGDDIWANRFDAGTGMWGTAATIEAGAGHAAEPQIALDGSGNAIAVWRQFNGTRERIWANRFDAGTGMWSMAAPLDNNAGDAHQPQIAFDGSGNAIAVWFQFDGTRPDIWANRFIVGTGWGTAETIETNAGNASKPQIAVDGSGNALAVWVQLDGTDNNIWANRFNLGSWGTAQLIETNDTGVADDPQIAVDGSGNALAVWRQSDGTRENIWANRFSAGAWATAELIETDNAGPALFPQIAFDGSGNAVAVWQQFDGAFISIWANRFD